MEITKINENIHRITLPYKDIFTTVYAIRTPMGALLFDAASYDTDAENYIVPFLEEVGISKEELKYVFISHKHADHAGGLNGLLEFYPDVCIVTRNPELKDTYGADYAVLMPDEEDVLLGMLKVVTIPGHTMDSAALLDLRDHTMVTGDCLQAYGIVGSQDWASNIRFPAEYLKALTKVRQLEIRSVVTAHNYYPYGYRADGKEGVLRMIDACEMPIRRLQRLICDNPRLVDEQIRALYNDDPHAPTIRTTVVAAMRDAIAEGRV